jgi:MFS family permease
MRFTYKGYLLVVLLILLAFNHVDRMALGLLLQHIKVDLQLSDTQLGFLTGIAFALFYSVMGIPIARWADRGNRVTIISCTAALGGAAVALCGLATNFISLMLIRVGVAVGEAGLVPPAHSLIADTFTRTERPRAVAIYLLGTPLSVVIGFFAAGWLNELYGWRRTFMILGIPSVILALMAWLTLREPRLQVSRARSAAVAVPSSQPGFVEVMRTLWVNRTFRHLLLCLAVMNFFGYGITQWKPSFFVRSFGLDTGMLGTWFAAIYGVCGLLGTYLGGEWATRYAAHDERRQLRIIAFALAGFGVISVALYLSTSSRMAFALLALSILGFNLTNGPLFATVQTLVPENMRATSIALIYLFANLIGMGFGPIAAGALSDGFRPWAGEESLRYALLALSPGYLWAAAHLWRASRTVAVDLGVGDAQARLPA